MLKIETLIAGGGIAGLACARELRSRGLRYLLVEREKEPGGLCRTVDCGGYLFDPTGHFLHFKDSKVREWVLSLAPGVFKRRTRRAAIRSRGVFTEYPYQENNAGLPAAVSRENVVGLFEARLKEAAGDPARGDMDFETWCRAAFGPGIARHFLIPYNRKLWKFPLKRLTTRWMGRFVPRPRIDRIVEGALSKRTSDSGYNADFLYPDAGGIAALPRALSAGLPGLFTGVSLLRFDPDRHEALLSTGLRVRYDRLISSLPLPGLVRIGKGIPSPVRRAVTRLKATSVYNINLGLRVPQPTPYAWVYFPEKAFSFHRAGSVSACVPSVAPPGCSSLYLEFSYRGRTPDARALGRRALRELRDLGWVRSPGDVVVRADLDLPDAYVVYDREREAAVGRILSHLRRKGVHSVGRYGRWEYGTMESAVVQGREAAAQGAAGTMDQQTMEQ